MERPVTGCCCCKNFDYFKRFLTAAAGAAGSPKDLRYL
jgi:hypothetical protein